MSWPAADMLLVLGAMGPSLTYSTMATSPDIQYNGNLPASPCCCVPQDFLVDLDFRTAVCLHVLHAVPLHCRLPRAGLLPARHGGDQVGNLELDPYVDLPFSHLPRTDLLPARRRLGWISLRLSRSDPPSPLLLTTPSPTPHHTLPSSPSVWRSRRHSGGTSTTCRLTT